MSIYPPSQSELKLNSRESRGKNAVNSRLIHFSGTRPLDSLPMISLCFWGKVVFEGFFEKQVSSPIAYGSTEAWEMYF